MELSASQGGSEKAESEKGQKAKQDEGQHMTSTLSKAKSGGGGGGRVQSGRQSIRLRGRCGIWEKPHARGSLSTGRHEVVGGGKNAIKGSRRKDRHEEG